MPHGWDSDGPVMVQVLGWQWIQKMEWSSEETMELDSDWLTEQMLEKDSEGHWILF